jgi:hypothetical protein
MKCDGMTIEAAKCNGWLVEAILLYNNGDLLLSLISRPSSYIRVFEIEIRHAVKKEAVQQAANIWLNSLSSSVELQEYMDAVFPTAPKAS